MPDGVDKAEYAGRLKHGLGTLRFSWSKLGGASRFGRIGHFDETKVFYPLDFFGVTKLVFLS